MAIEESIPGADFTPLEKKLNEKDKNLFLVYKRLKKYGEDVWSDFNDISEQIRHGFDHSIHLHQYADKLLENELEKDTLTPKELFLILAAVYLHDIGMQTGWAGYLEIANKRGSLTKEDKKKIRENHPQTSAHVIRQFKDKDRYPGFYKDVLPPTEVVSPILFYHLADICAVHRSPELKKTIKEDEKWANETEGIRKDLLAAVLQFADILHMDKSRVNETIFKQSLNRYLKHQPDEFDYEPKDWVRLFQNHYVEGLSIEQDVGQKGGYYLHIKALCRFKDEKKPEVNDYFKRLYKNRLESREESCLSILEGHGIFVVEKSDRIEVECSDDKIEFPEEMICFLGLPKTNTSAKGENRSSQKREKSFTGETKDKIESKICEFLSEEGSPAAQKLTQTLADLLGVKAEENRGSAVAKALVKGESLVDFIEYLWKSVVTIAKDKKNAARTGLNLPLKTWELSYKIIQCILPMFIKDHQWIVDNRKSLSSESDLKLPTDIDAVVEIIYSALTDTAARLRMNGASRAIIEGEDKIDYHYPESGPDIDTAENEITEAVIKKIFPDISAKELKDIKAGKTHDVNHLLKGKKFIGEHYYLFLGNSNPSWAGRNNLILNLKSKYPELDILTKIAEQIIIDAEKTVHSALLLFFRSKPE